MLKNIRNNIRKKRASNKFFWKVLFNGKDRIWKLINKTDMNVKKSISRLSSIDYTDLSLCKPIKKYAFVFVCQEGKLEIESVFLAASLKRYLKCEYELIAAIPSPPELMGTPNDITLAIFKKMGIRKVNFYNNIVANNRSNKLYMLTNKIYCFRIPTSADKLIFLDSDFLCYSDFYGNSRFSIPFSARPVALPGTLKYEGMWHKFYEALNVEMPNIRIRVESDDRVNYIPPCFNSGFVAINSDLALRLSDCWFECWEAINNKELIKHHPYFMDQIALAVASTKMNIPFEIIDRSWIYQYFHICHVASKRKDNPEVVRIMLSLIEEYPEIMELLKRKMNLDYQFLYQDSL
jgi:hypothetical protein